MHAGFGFFRLDMQNGQSFPYIGHAIVVLHFAAHVGDNGLWIEGSRIFTQFPQFFTQQFFHSGSHFRRWTHAILLQAEFRDFLTGLRCCPVFAVREKAAQTI